MPVRGLASAFICLALAASCGKADTAPQPGKLATYSGVYMLSFEGSTFLPSDLAEHWWLAGPFAKAIVAVKAVELPGYGSTRIMHLKVRGKVTERGHYGHSGNERELVVSEVLDIAPATLDDFRRAACRLPSRGENADADQQAWLDECKRLGAG